MKIRNTYHRFIALSLATLMLVTSMSFSVDMHFCKDELKSFSLVGQAEVCHPIKAKEKTETNACPFHQKIQKEKASSQIQEKGCQKTCCDNQKILIDFDENLVQITTRELSNLSFISSTPIQYIQNRIVQSIYPHQNYHPPLLNRDIPIFVQSFLL